MRSATIYYKNDVAEILTETNDGNYVFQYDTIYLKTYPNQFLTFTMPVTRWREIMAEQGSQIQNNILFNNTILPYIVYYIIQNIFLFIKTL